MLLAAAGDEAHGKCAGLRDRLSAAGLRVCEHGEPPSAGAIVLFERADDHALTLVRELSMGSARRIVAVGLGPGSLAGPAPWELLAAGAADAVSWAGEQTAEAMYARFLRWQQVDELAASPLVRENLIGEDPVWQATLRGIVEIARFSEASVLVTGESGTGKELAAQLIHALGSRSKEKLVVVDCTTIVPTLSGSEFFGHERGAFTGAVTAREGAFALADGGTLFLDEVGELPMALQAELLRVIQERHYKPVGSNRWRETEFRLVCATNRDLLAEQTRGSFRADLYYRIAAWTCRLPALRERRGDILRLARHFLAEQLQRDAPELDAGLTDYLQARDYPGNVRELRQLIGRICHRYVGTGRLTVGVLPADERPAWCAAAPAPRPQPAGEGATTRGQGDPLDELEAAVGRALARGTGLKELLGSTRDAALRLALAESGQVREAARRLGVSERAVHQHRAKWAAAEAQGEPAERN